MRKSAGDMILIPRNGFSTSKSLSSVIMQSAFPATANSRNQITVIGVGKQIKRNKTYIILNKNENTNFNFICNFFNSSVFL
jgi:hypothetical protein